MGGGCRTTQLTHTLTQTHRHTDTQADTYRQTDRHTHTHADTHADTHTDTQISHIHAHTQRVDGSTYARKTTAKSSQFHLFRRYE